MGGSGVPKVIQWAHGGALLGPLAFRWTTVARPSFSRTECASRRPGRGGAGRSGPRDRRVTAEHVTQPASTSARVTCSRVRVRSRGLSDDLASRGASRHARRRPTMRDALSGRSGDGVPEPPPTPDPPIPPPPAPPAHPGATRADRHGRPPHPNALNDPAHHTGRRTRTPSQQPSGRGGPARADRHHDLHAPRHSKPPPE